MGSNRIITIARQYGSGGKTVGQMLAKDLGIDCYDREILRMASDDSGINERLFGMSDEKIRKAGCSGRSGSGNAAAMQRFPVRPCGPGLRPGQGAVHIPCKGPAVPHAHRPAHSRQSVLYAFHSAP